MNNNQARKIFAKEKHIREFYKDISLTPLILAKDDYGYIKDVTELIANILEKTVKIYFKDKKTQNFFDFNSKQKNIIQDFRPDLFTLYLSRFDGFWDDDKKDLKFLEFNTNFPGGVDRLDGVGKLINVVNGNKYKLGSDLENSYIKLIEYLYQKTDRQGIILMVYGSMFDQNSEVSLLALKRIIKDKLNIDAQYCHWKDIVCDGNDIYYQNKKVSLVFRSALAQRMWQYDYKYVKPILKVLGENKNIIMFNLPQSYICGAKNLFALWHEKWFTEKLDKDEKKCITKYIPRTMLLSNKLLKKSDLLINKDKWVMKPVAGIGGGRVYVGKKYDLKKWTQLVESHFGSKHWIAQEFIKTKLHYINSLNTKTGEITKKEAYYNFSPWIINKKFAGISIRYSSDLVINVKKGGGIATVLVK